jgi:ankyrin repeat protein
MIGLLMDAGADPDAKNALGQTATDVAKINGNDEAAQAIKVLAATRQASAADKPATADQ